jgi:hypothetical protein
VNNADADIDRYRALLKDADDEPKRLALIQLIVAEAARNKLAAESRAIETDSELSQSLPFKLPGSPELSPPPFESQPASFSEPSTKPELQGVGGLDVGQVQQSFPVAPFEDATASGIAPVLSEPTPANDIAGRIAKILGSRPGVGWVVPTAATSSSDAPSSDNGVEDSIAALIRSVLEKRDRL